MGSTGLRRDIGENCTSCKRCVKECLFLKEHGTPKDIANEKDFNKEFSFLCSQCGLCDAVCPEGLKIKEMFHELRKEALKDNGKILQRYKKLLAYESLGSSKFLSIYKIPDGCDTVLFPGCEFAHTRPDMVKELYLKLRERDGKAGIVMDCCLRPSYDLGREEFFNENVRRIRENLTRRGIKKVITVCAGCYIALKKHLAGIEVNMVYEESGLRFTPLKIKEALHIIDPCSVRFEKGLMDSVRKVFTENGIAYDELRYSKEMTLCCGEGGGTPHVDAKYKEKWLEKRKSEMKKGAVTYCAGCTNNLKSSHTDYHLLDILLGSRKKNRSHNVFGYLRRALLKRYLMRL